MPPDARLRPEEESPETAARTITDESHLPRHHRMGSRLTRRRTQLCYPPVPRTPHQLDGAKAAAEYLLGLGLPPLFPVDVIRALWRRGDRELAITLARIRGVA
jgi:hypothetical protein